MAEETICTCGSTRWNDDVCAECGYKITDEDMIAALMARHNELLKPVEKAVE